MPQTHSNDLIIAFDIDNTLFDPTGECYRKTVSQFLADADLGLTVTPSTLEDVRAYGTALERMGLANIIHQRDHVHAVALLLLIRCSNGKLLDKLDINLAEQGQYLGTLDGLKGLHAKTERGSLNQRLSAEWLMRSQLANGPEISELRSEMERLAEHALVIELAETYRRIETHNMPESPLGLVESLSASGFTCVVISEGRDRIQRKKLERLGLTNVFANRVLISGNAAEVPGVGDLHASVSRLADQAGTIDGSSDDELAFLWSYRCAIQMWSKKTPWFYGRCLHALRQNTENPEAALAEATVIPDEEWKGSPLSFVMVGNRYDKDIYPLIELLGTESAFTLRLRTGKYGHLHPEEKLAEQLRPDQTFHDWVSTADFLQNVLTADQVQPIRSSPAILPPDLLDAEMVRRGLKSSLQAVRQVAAMISETSNVDAKAL